MTELILFLSTASLVFLLGIQQLNVHGGHYLLAVITSFFIGGTQIFLWRTMPTASITEIASTLAGGPVGIVLAMRFHPVLVRVLMRGRASE